MANSQSIFCFKLFSKINQHPGASCSILGTNHHKATAYTVENTTTMYAYLELFIGKNVKPWHQVQTAMQKDQLDASDIHWLLGDGEAVISMA